MFQQALQRTVHLFHVLPLIKILSFDERALILEVEAGISLGEIYQFLVEYELCLPVQPGHPEISLGGWSLSTVTVKNQVKEGYFCDHAEEISFCGIPIKDTF